jgi:hypothetical protein
MKSYEARETAKAREIIQAEQKIEQKTEITPIELLYQAARKQDGAVLLQALYHVDINVIDPKTKKPVIFTLAVEGNNNAVEFLLSNGASMRHAICGYAMASNFRRMDELMTRMRLLAEDSTSTVTMAEVRRAFFYLGEVSIGSNLSYQHLSNYAYQWAIDYTDPAMLRQFFLGTVFGIAAHEPTSGQEFSASRAEAQWKAAVTSLEHVAKQSRNDAFKATYEPSEDDDDDNDPTLTSAVSQVGVVMSNGFARSGNIRFARAALENYSDEEEVEDNLYYFIERLTSFHFNESAKQPTSIELNLDNDAATTARINEFTQYGLITGKARNGDVQGLIQVLAVQNPDEPDLKHRLVRNAINQLYSHGHLASSMQLFEWALENTLPSLLFDDGRVTFHVYGNALARSKDALHALHKIFPRISMLQKSDDGPDPKLLQREFFRGISQGSATRHDHDHSVFFSLVLRLKHDDDKQKEYRTYLMNTFFDNIELEKKSLGAKQIVHFLAGMRDQAERMTMADLLAEQTVCPHNMNLLLQKAQALNPLSNPLPDTCLDYHGLAAYFNPDLILLLLQIGKTRQLTIDARAVIFSFLLVGVDTNQAGICLTQLEMMRFSRLGLFKPRPKEEKQVEETPNPHKRQKR